MARDLPSARLLAMKTTTVFQIVSSLILSAATPTAFAAGHGGGGGFGGGGHFGGGFGGGAHFGGGGFHSGPAFGKGGRFSFGARPVFGRPVMVRPPANVSTTSARSNRLSHQRASVPSIDRHVTANPRAQTTTRGRQPTESAKNHIFARQDASAHRDWDHRSAHFWHRHWWCWDGGAWIGLDDGFYPWDYFPYYAYDYYPYDYYPGSYADTEPYYYDNGVYSSTPMRDPTVATVQTELTQQGYYGGPVDGIYGPATRDAVAKYQIAKNLEVTGSLSPDTLTALGLPEMTPG